MNGSRPPSVAAPRAPAMSHAPAVRDTSGGPAARTVGARRGPRLAHVWLAAVLAVTFAAANGFPVDQTDYWWTVKLGERLLAGGGLPAADPLSFTATRQPYVEQQWLAQVILAGVHRLGGLETALLLRAALLLTAMALVYRVARWAAGTASPAAAAGASLLALLLVLPGAATRPQLLAIPLFAVFLAGTTIWAGRGWTLVALPLAMLAWVNLHGSFPLGWVVVGAALAGRAWERRTLPRLAADPLARRLALLLLLCGGALVCNPYGLGIVPWLVDFLFLHTGGGDAAVIATEWAPTSLAERSGGLFFLSVALLAVVLVRVGPPDAATCLRLLAFGALGLLAVRSTLWWGLVQAPALAWGLVRLPRGRSAERLAAAAPPSVAIHGSTLVNIVLIGVLALAALGSLPPLRAALTGAPSTLADPDQPRDAAAFLTAREGGSRLFNYLDWGGYLAWRLAPADRIFVDGRFGIYPPAVYRDYFRISEARGDWAARLAVNEVDALVLSHAGQPALLAALSAAPGSWRLAWCDAQAAVYLPASGFQGVEATCPAPAAAAALR